MYSDLAEGYIQTPFCNPREEEITKITVHHMACVQSGKACAEYEQWSNNSANYCIGVDGDIWCACGEEYRAWTSSSAWNDHRAITIECSNCDAEDPWPVSEATWNSLVKLCVDICKRYNFRLDYTGDKDGSLTIHRFYAQTACPGEYLLDRMVPLEREVNAILDGEKKEEKSMTREEKEMMVKMEFNEWLHRDPDKETLEKLVETLPDDVEYNDFNTAEMDDMLADTRECSYIHRIEAIKSFYNTLLGREASDKEAAGWERHEDGSLRNIYRWIANSDEAQDYKEMIKKQSEVMFRK